MVQQPWSIKIPSPQAQKKTQKLKDKTFYSVNVLTVTAALKYIKLLKLKVDQEVLQIM